MILLDIEHTKDQGEFTGVFCTRPQNFAWFLGAGASASAGLPTATDILWDLKRQLYCREENQDITRQDMQSEPVRSRIQAYVESKGFPSLWADDEYSACFQRLFGEDRERQRRYLKTKLADENAKLTVGSRALGGMIAAGLCRVAFTTNFDGVVERAGAEVAGYSLTAFHLEGSRAASQALLNEEFPIYCKLHGDFRYDSIKNLSEDLAKQNAELATCFIQAANRFGIVVTGYSGRDESVMELFREALKNPNPFPHGLYWTHIKGNPPRHPVTALVAEARARGVNAALVPIETFDTLMLRLWRNLSSKPSAIDAKVRRSTHTSVSIDLPTAGTGMPLLRTNALPIQSLPKQCLELSFKIPKTWDHIQMARRTSGDQLILTKSDAVWCWGDREVIRATFPDLTTIVERVLPTDLDSPKNLFLRGFLAEALSRALALNKPLHPRVTASESFLVADSRTNSTDLDPLKSVVGKTSGTVPNLVAPATDRYPSEPVTWAECVRISLDYKNGTPWLLLIPDIWIGPKRARHDAEKFLDSRRGDRFNPKYNAILEAWIQILFGKVERNTTVNVATFADGSAPENATFTLASRTGFSKRLLA